MPPPASSASSGSPPSDRSLLPGHWELPLEIRLRLGDEAGRQRAMSAAGHLLLVLHAPPGADPGVREGCYFWRDPQGVWSGSDAAKRSIDLGGHLDQFERDIEKLQQAEDAAKTAREYSRALTS